MIRLVLTLFLGLHMSLLMGCGDSAPSPEDAATDEALGGMTEEEMEAEEELAP